MALKDGKFSTTCVNLIVILLFYKKLTLVNKELNAGQMSGDLKQFLHMVQQMQGVCVSFLKRSTELLKKKLEIMKVDTLQLN